MSRDVISEYREYRESLRKGIRGIFDFEGFFSYNGLKKSEQGYGASVTITSDQVITVLNVKDGRLPHEFTQATIAAEIHNFPEELTLSKKIEILRKKNIEMRLVNEFGRKAIFIFFPDEITEEQIDLLEAYQNTYGEIIKQISIRYEDEEEDNKPIVFFKDKDNNDNYSHSFENAIKHAESLPRVEKQEYPIEFILGEVLSSDGLILCNSSELKSLRGFNEKALVNGVTTEDCKGFVEHIKSWWKNMRSDR